MPHVAEKQDEHKDQGCIFMLNFSFFTFFVATLALFPIFSEASNFTERPVINCAITSHLGIYEIAPGRFEYRSGNPYHGGSEIRVPVNLSANKTDNGCQINIQSINQSGGENPSTQNMRFSFPSSQGGMRGSLVSDNFSSSSISGLSCSVGLRYEGSVGQCEAPTANEPGDQCYRQPGTPVIINIQDSTFASTSPNDLNRIDLNSGGIFVTTYGYGGQRFRAQSGGNEELHPIHTVFWKEGDQWCSYKSVYLTDYSGSCTPVQGAQELRNPEGRVTGVIFRNGDHLEIRQVMRPYQSSGYSINGIAPVIRIGESNNGMTARTLSRIEGPPRGGSVTVSGEMTRGNRNWNENPQSYLVGGDQSYVSDCNEMTSPQSQRTSTTFSSEASR